MDVVLTPCAGLEVHKQRLTACRVLPDPTGQEGDGLGALQPVGTMPIAWLAWADGLAAAGLTPVAMESTGEDWKPVYPRVAGPWTVWRVHAAHGKQVPGRKTDQAAARGVAQVRREGVRQARYMPPAGQRDGRALTRSRTTLVQERRRAVHRGQGVLERAHMLLASVASDVMGVAGRARLAALGAEHGAPATKAAGARGRMRSKRPGLAQALPGVVWDPQRLWLTTQWAPMDFLDAQLAALGQAILERLRALDPAPPEEPAPLAGGPSPPLAPERPSPLTLTRAVERLETIPGIDRRGAARIVAEMGSAMTRFGTASRLAAWAGVAPGNDASAGKRRSGTTRQGHGPVRAGVTPLAHAAARPQGTSLSALYDRLAARRGKKRAIMAVAHAMVVSVFHRLSHTPPDHELGANSFDEHQRQHIVDRLTRRIARLGSHVRLEALPSPTS